MNKKKKETAFQQLTFDVYIGKLPKNTTESELEQLFSKYGNISGILCRYNKGEYGYAIVKFIHKRDAEKVLQQANLCIKGSYIEVKCAQRKDLSLEDCNGKNQINPCFLPELQRSSFPIGKFHTADPYSFPRGSEYLPVINCVGKQNKPDGPVMMEVMCTSIENAITFYGYPVFRCEELHNISTELNAICINQPRLCRKPAVKRVYAALFMEDLCWYRCLILQNNIASKPGMCSVFYIDYGNQEDVNCQNIVELPEAIRNIPPFSSKFVFSNLVCNSKLQSNVSYLHHLVNKRMSLCVTSVPGLSEYFVSKCSCNGIDVISEIVNKGFATYKTKKSVSSKPPAACVKSEKIKEKPNVKKTIMTNGNGETFNGGAVKPVGNSNQIDSVDEVVNESKVVSPKHRILSHSSVSKSENNTDLIPKKIMKRRCQSEAAVSVTTENQKGLENQHYGQMDVVLSNLKLVNNIRDLISLSEDDIIIKNAVELLMKETSLPFEGIANHIEESFNAYTDLLSQIRNCSDVALLVHLKSQRDQFRNTLCAELKEYLNKFDTSVIARRNQIQRMITDLESNSNAWMNVYLDNYPSTVEGLLAEYKKSKDAKNSVIENARKKTNEKHKAFIEFLGLLQKEFSLNMVENRICSSSSPDNISGMYKEAFSSNKFETTLCELGKALEEEIETCALNKGTCSTNVIQCILDKLDIPKEKLDAECLKYEKYSSMYQDLCSLTNLQSAFSELSIVQENIKNISKKLTYQNSTEIQTTHVMFQLHHQLLKEDNLMEVLARAFEQHFPELNAEHPELKLLDYHKYKYLLKNNWKPEYFSHLGECSRMEFSYLSQYLEEPVVIKEFLFVSSDEKNFILQKVMQWNEIKSDYLVKVKGLFQKDETALCVLLPLPWKTLFEAPCMPHLNDSKKTCQILQDVLKGLRDIHSRGLVHGTLHPLSILYNDGKILLDFCNGPKVLNGKSLIKGINFQHPKCQESNESADMYSFGCLVLWALFPNLLFTSTNDGVPNLAAFRSIVEELLSPKDYTSLSALVDIKTETRPTSSMLLSSGFLKDFKCFRNCNNTTA